MNASELFKFGRVAQVAGWRTTQKLNCRDLLLLICLVYINISEASFFFSVFYFRPRLFSKSIIDGFYDSIQKYLKTFLKSNIFNKAGCQLLQSPFICVPSVLLKKTFINYPIYSKRVMTDKIHSLTSRKQVGCRFMIIQLMSPKGLFLNFWACFGIENNYVKKRILHIHQ